MTAWDPPSGWEWTGGLPGVHICYDHRFEAAGEDLTTLDVRGQPRGPAGRRWPARCSPAIYGRLIDRAIPRLQRWILT